MERYVLDSKLQEFWRREINEFTNDIAIRYQLDRKGHIDSPRMRRTRHRLVTHQTSRFLQQTGISQHISEEKQSGLIPSIVGCADVGRAFYFGRGGMQFGGRCALTSALIGTSYLFSDTVADDLGYPEVLQILAKQKKHSRDLKRKRFNV